MEAFSSYTKAASFVGGLNPEILNKHQRNLLT